MSEDKMSIVKISVKLSKIENYHDKIVQNKHLFLAKLFGFQI